MAAGKPIIGMIDGSANDVINDSQCGICVDAGDVDGLAKAMRSFVLENDRYKDCGDNGRKYFINNFSKEKIMKKLESELERLVK